MAKQAQLHDGTVLEFPDDTPDNVIDIVVKKHISGNSPQAPQMPEREQKARASVLNRFGQGALDPMIGGAQLLARGLAAGEDPNSFLGSLPESVDSYWKSEHDKQAQAAKAENVGTDVAGFAGNVLSPVNALVAARGVNAGLPILSKIKQGAALGAASGALQPVFDGDFTTQKALQAGLGAGAGGLLTGIFSKVGDIVARKLSAFHIDDAINKADDAINSTLDEMKIERGLVPQETIDTLKNQIVTGLQKGKSIDPKAALRQADFKSLGIQPLQGQITREPLQFAQERNLRGVVPEIAQVMQTQGEKLRAGLSSTADDSYLAGEKLSNALKSYDDKLRANVSNLYNQARTSSGKDLNIPLQGLATNYANILDKYQEKIPGGIKKKFEDLGLLSGKQLKAFNIEDADQMLKTINDHVGADKATNNALSELRNAVKQSVNDIDPSGGVFAPAVKAAKERFGLHDEIPALKSVADGKAINDNFINKYIVNGDTKSVNALANALKQESPEAFAEMKNQVKKTLEKAAYGENIAGDAPLAPERLAKALSKFGNEKLKAVFSKDEIDKLHVITRVGSYINKMPDVSPVNTSNTYVSAAMNNLPGAGRTAAIVRAVKGAADKEIATAKALNIKIPETKSKLPAKQIKALSSILGSSAMLGGVVAGRQ